MMRFLLASLLVLLVALASCGDTGTSTVAQPTQPVSHPTQATKTKSYPTSAGPAILGADIGTFIARYGQPDSHSQPAQGSYDFGNLSIVTAQSKALSILDSSPTDQGWDESQAKAICLAFAPPDSVYKRQMTLLDPQGNPMDIQLVYYSASLAHQFPSSDFTDENSNQTTPGTFALVLGYASGSTSSFLSCSAQVGLQQK